jgi:hypothetical protein
MATILEQLIGQITGTVPDLINITGIVPVDSSWVDTVSYDSRLKALTVDLQDGSEYIYYNVPESVYQKLITSSSPGSVINRVIKSGFYPFVRA